LRPSIEPDQSVLPRTDARRELLRRYTRHGLSTLFCWIRYWHSNVPGIETHVPPDGTILDLGCGHGVLSNYLAIRSSQRRVIGFDLSPHRIAIARAAAPANAEFRCQDILDSPPLPCRVIIVADVLHHLRSYADGDDLIARCVERLPPGGLLVVKEIGKHPLWKYLCTRPIDTLFYRGEVHFRSPAQFAALFDRLALDSQFIALHAWRPLSHVMYVCRKRPVATS